MFQPSEATKKPSPPKRDSKRMDHVQGSSHRDLHPNEPEGLGFLVGDRALWPVVEGTREVRIHRIYRSGLGIVCASVIVDVCPSGEQYHTICRVEDLRKWDDPEGKQRLIEQHQPTQAAQAAKNVLESFGQESLW